MKVGDLVRMKTHDTGLVGIVLAIYARGLSDNAQIGIKWFKGSGKVDWEPESWLEVVSASR
jgi:hypothetical protein